MKETGTIRDWRKAATRLLSSIEFSINATVEITDAQWRDEIKEVIKLGKAHIREADHIADLFGHLSATLARIVFVQIGFLPRRSSHDKSVPLAEPYWRLNGFRSVQYVQTDAQRRALARYLERPRNKSAEA
jgi:hypothetical protein